MSIIARHARQQADHIPQKPIDPHKYNLFKDIGSFDQDYEIVAESLTAVNEPFIEEYVNNTIGKTHCLGLKVVETYAVDRLEDKIMFMDHLPDKRLLWHGTRKQNVYNILKDGFDLKYAKKTGMFGNGVYFSDCVTKAVNYADRQCSSCSSCSFSYLFLCEVALGKIMACTGAVYDAKEQLGSANSVWGVGYYQSQTAKYWNADNPKESLMICPGRLETTQRHSLDYNEYIVYHRTQVRLRYLVKVQHVYASPSTILAEQNTFKMYQVSAYPENQLKSLKYEPKMEVRQMAGSMELFMQATSLLQNRRTRRKPRPPPRPLPNAYSNNYLPPLPNSTVTNFVQSVNIQLSNLTATLKSMQPPAPSFPMPSNSQAHMLPSTSNYQPLINNVPAYPMPIMNMINPQPSINNNLPAYPMQQRPMPIMNMINPPINNNVPPSSMPIMNVPNPQLTFSNYRPQNSTNQNIQSSNNNQPSIVVPQTQQQLGTAQNPIVLTNDVNNTASNVQAVPQIQPVQKLFSEAANNKSLKNLDDADLDTDWFADNDKSQSFIPPKISNFKRSSNLSLKPSIAKSSKKVIALGSYYNPIQLDDI